MSDDFCFQYTTPQTGKPNRLGKKSFYLLFKHASGTIGKTTDLKEAMKLAREHAQNSQYQYVVMKAVAILRSPEVKPEEVMLEESE
jgi:hypothetical protein